MPVSLDFSLPAVSGVSASIDGDDAVVVALPPQPGRPKYLRIGPTIHLEREPVLPIQLGASIGNSQEGGLITLKDETKVYFQLRYEDPDNEDQLGPWSNIFDLTPPRVVGVAFVDQKKAIPAATTSPTQPAAISLASMGLTFSAGHTLIVHALGMISSPAGSTHKVDPGTMSGWTLHDSIASTANGSGSVRGGGAVFSKVSDGTEDALIPLVWSGGSGGTITHYAAYFVASIDADGAARLFANAKQVTALAPATQQAILAGLATDPLYCYMMSISQGAATGATFTGDTPLDIDQSQNITTTVAATLKVKLYDLDIAVPSLTANKTDTGNCNLLMSGALSFIQET